MQFLYFRSGSPPDLIFREGGIDEDRIAGSARKLGGKVQEKVGRFTGDTQTQMKGMANQAAGPPSFLIQIKFESDLRGVG